MCRVSFRAGTWAVLVSGAMVSVSAVERGWSVERGAWRYTCNGMYIYYIYAYARITYGYGNMHSICDICICVYVYVYRCIGV